MIGLGCAGQQAGVPERPLQPPRAIPAPVLVLAPSRCHTQRGPRSTAHDAAVADWQLAVVRGRNLNCVSFFPQQHPVPTATTPRCRQRCFFFFFSSSSFRSASSTSLSSRVYIASLQFIESTFLLGVLLLAAGCCWFPIDSRPSLFFFWAGAFQVIGKATSVIDKALR